MNNCRPCAYKNLAIQMHHLELTRRKLAKRINMEYKSMCRKLNGDTAITIDEAIMIHEVVNKAIPIEELFSRE